MSSKLFRVWVKSTITIHRYEMATQMLDWNDIKTEEYATAVRKLLTEGRRKPNNIFIVGEEGCGKSFLMDPLEDIYKVLTTPASKYGWADIETDELEVVYLNDFRWGPENIGPDGTGLIEWDVLLRLLDGSTTKMKRPRNVFSSDALLPKSNTIPVFANGSALVESIAFANKKRREQDMMDMRWTVFYFKYRIPKAVRVHVPPCGSCFARLALLGAQPN